MGRGISHPQGRGPIALIFAKQKLWGDPLRRARAQPSAHLSLRLLLLCKGRVRAGAPAFRAGVAGRNRPAEVGGRRRKAAGDREETSSRRYKVELPL